VDVREDVLDEDETEEEEDDDDDEDEEEEEEDEEDDEVEVRDDELVDELELVVDITGGPLLYWNMVRRLEPPQISFPLPLQAILQPVLPSGAGPPPFSSLLSQ
jgi:hypothetical protein